MIETWQNNKTFDAHVAAAHTKQYRDELLPMTGSPLDERVSLQSSITPAIGEIPCCLRVLVRG